MTMKANTLFITTDLALVTTLSLSFPIKYIDKSNGIRAEFVFDNSPELNKFIEAFWKGELVIEPRQFFNHLRDIKARIYDKR